MEIKYYKVYDKVKRFIRKINSKEELQEKNYLKGVARTARFMLRTC